MSQLDARSGATEKLNGSMVTSPPNSSLTRIPEILSSARCGSNVGGSRNSRVILPPSVAIPLPLLAARVPKAAGILSTGETAAFSGCAGVASGLSRRRFLNGGRSGGHLLSCGASRTFRGDCRHFRRICRAGWSIGTASNQKKTKNGYECQCLPTHKHLPINKVIIDSVKREILNSFQGIYKGFHLRHYIGCPLQYQVST